MSKVITVSRFFPSYHPRKGEPTYFVEKIYAALGDLIPVRKNGCYFKQLSELNPEIKPTPILIFYDSVNSEINEGKHHTIRAGKRWKTGDKASIRVWGDDVNPKSGRKGAYHSKQITIAPDVEVTVFDFEIKEGGYVFIDNKIVQSWDYDVIAKNDGLSQDDLMAWFKYPKPFSGQIIIWNKDLKY